MRQQQSVSLSGVLLVGFLLLAALVLIGRHPYGEAHGGGDAAGVQRPGGCLGFVVLPNGSAVLSGLPVSPAPSSTGGRRDPTAGARPPLLVYTHGQEIIPQAGMLCVSVYDAGTLRWMAFSDQAAPGITVESLRGAPTCGGRANAAFALTMRQNRALVDPAQVRVLVRMPQHDRYMPGGHGPANDPEVQGLIAQPVGQGRYIIENVDFTMYGPWLLEIHVQQGSETHKAYVAVYVGAE